ncbi:hypothetical protein BH24ACT15_BH24ACT15_05330 [soil metagenome]
MRRNPSSTAARSTTGRMRRSDGSGLYRHTFRDVGRAAHRRQRPSRAHRTAPHFTGHRLSPRRPHRRGTKRRTASLSITASTPSHIRPTRTTSVHSCPVTRSLTRSRTSCATTTSSMRPRRSSQHLQHTPDSVTEAGHGQRSATRGGSRERNSLLSIRMASLSQGQRSQYKVHLPYAPNAERSTADDTRRRVSTWTPSSTLLLRCIAPDRYRVVTGRSAMRGRGSGMVTRLSGPATIAGKANPQCSC